MAFYITNNHGLAGTGTVNVYFPEELRKAYEAQIQLLRDENTHLKGILEKVLNKD